MQGSDVNALLLLIYIQEIRLGIQKIGEEHYHLWYLGIRLWHIIILIDISIRNNA